MYSRQICCLANCTLWTKAWTLKAVDIARVGSLEIRERRRLLRIPWTDYGTNESMLEELHINELLSINFWSGMSTIDAMRKLFGRFYELVDAELYPMVSLLDLNKAFDLVPHNKLLDKLDRLGLKEVANKLFPSTNFCYVKDLVKLLRMPFRYIFCFPTKLDPQIHI